jgi:hypothetical protein
VQPQGGSGPNGEFWGWDFWDAYGVQGTPLNQILGLLEFDGYTNSDISLYERYGTNVGQENFPIVPLVNVLIGGFDGTPTTHGQTEVTLDIDMAIAMSGGWLSEIIVYEAPTNGPWLAILSRMADDNLAEQMSCSWGSDARYDPTDGEANVIFRQMAAQGQSMFISSGDTDATIPGVPFYFPEDTPYVTLVGGTELTTTGPQGSYGSESVWNWNNNTGSDGGLSTTYLIPSWQSGVSMSANKGSPTKRNVPDVALTADNVFIYLNGAPDGVAGTSIAAPLWAGLTSIVNYQARVSGGPPVGFLNPALYETVGEISTKYARDFHDITTGNNYLTNESTYFPAVPGYDLATGWGTPVGTNIINDLALSGSCSMELLNTLNVARAYHTAALLQNSNTLVAGGLTTSGGATPTVEIYENGSWYLATSMNTARAYHTSTRLNNGSVLVVGGSNSTRVLAGAELYNPSTGAWTFTTYPLNTAREFHTATLLANGTVLVAGGANSSGVLSSAEIYNPTTESWSYTAYPLNTAREYHTATLLPSSGLVLVAGGYGASGTTLTAAELYNPSSETWTNTGSLNDARELDTATMLTNGLVLVAGGWSSAYGRTIASAELYYPAYGYWERTGNLKVAREEHTATLLLPDGLVVVAGGENSALGAVGSAEVYNPVLQEWTWTCTLNAPRYAHTATLTGDYVIFAAGVGANGSALPSTEYYSEP